MSLNSALWMVACLLGGLAIGVSAGTLKKKNDLQTATIAQQGEALKEARLISDAWEKSAVACSAALTDKELTCKSCN